MNTRTRSLPRWLLAGVFALCFVPTAAFAQAVCPSKLGVVFSESARGCLSDSPLALMVPRGWRTPLAISIPASGRFSLALAPHTGTCPAAAGFAANTSTSSLNFGMDRGVREARALRECDEAVAQQSGSSASVGCKCQIVLSDGRSPLGRTEFEERASAAALRMLAGARVVSTAEVSGADVQSATALQSLAAVAPVPAAVFRLNSLRLSVPGLMSDSGGLAGSAPVRPELAPVPSPTAVIGAELPQLAPPLEAPPPETPTASSGDKAAAPDRLSTAPVLTVSSADLAALRLQLAELQTELARRHGSKAVASRHPMARGLRTVALVVGNSRYREIGQLPNAVNDARAIERKLRSFGVQVALVTDATQRQLRAALTEFADRSRQADVALFFFAGHGLQLEGVNHLAPVDMRADAIESRSLGESSITLNEVLTSMSASTRLVFLDACRDNPVPGSQTTGRPAWSTGLAPVSVTSGTLISYATRDGSTADDGLGDNSPYTQALLQHLDAEEDIAIVLRRVRQTVLAATGRRQEPWEYGSLVGDALVLSQVAMR